MVKPTAKELAQAEAEVGRAYDELDRAGMGTSAEQRAVAYAEYCRACDAFQALKDRLGPLKR